jgi:molecular chaperone DnaK (HSP70)
MTADLVQRTETTTSLVIRQAGLDWPQMDRVLLVGGASRMPAVRQMLRKLTGKEPDRTQSPDEAVAHGAALYAGTLMPRDAGASHSACELLNVNAHSLGVVGLHRRTREKTNVVLIPKNTQLPACASKTFRTAQPDQRTIRVAVVEGESERPEDCIAVGECVVRDLPPGLPANTKIEVEYRYAANGRVSVLARVPSIRHSAHVDIQRDQAPNVEDLATWRARLLGKPERHSGALAQASDQITIDLADRASIQKRLDALHAKIGQIALRCALPDALVASQQMAASAAAELANARAALEEAEQAQQATLHDPAALHQAANVARVKAACDQAKLRADFTCIVLGRECIDRDYRPPDMDREFHEARQLREQLERLGT